MTQALLTQHDRSLRPRMCCRVTHHATHKAPFRASIYDMSGQVIASGDSDSPGKARRVAFMSLRVSANLSQERGESLAMDELLTWARNVRAVGETILKHDPTAEYANDLEARGMAQVMGVDVARS